MKITGEINHEATSFYYSLQNGNIFSLSEIKFKASNLKVLSLRKIKDGLI